MEKTGDLLKRRQMNFNQDKMLFKLDIGDGVPLYAFSDVSNKVFVIEPSISRIKLKVAVSNPRIVVGDDIIDINDGRDLNNNKAICSRGKLFKSFVKHIIPPNEINSMNSDDLHDRVAFITAVACSIDSLFESAGLMLLAMSVADDKTSRNSVSRELMASPLFSKWRKIHAKRLQSSDADKVDKALHHRLVNDHSAFPDWSWSPGWS